MNSFIRYIRACHTRRNASLIVHHINTAIAPIMHSIVIQQQTKPS